MKELAADAITQIFCSSKIVEYNQAKWLGFDESLDSYIQNHSVNGIGYGAWRMLLGKDPDADSDDENLGLGGASATSGATAMIASEDCDAIVPHTHAANGSVCISWKWRFVIFKLYA